LDNLGDNRDEPPPKHHGESHGDPTHLGSVVFLFTSNYIITAMLVCLPVGIALGSSHFRTTIIA